MGRTDILLIILWGVSLLLYLISIILEYKTNKAKIKVRENQFVCIYNLYKEIKRLNTRLDSYYNRENEEQ